MDIQVTADFTEVQKYIDAYRAALNSFCAEYIATNPGGEEEAIAGLERIADHYGISISAFGQAVSVLKGEAEATEIG